MLRLPRITLSIQQHIFLRSNSRLISRSHLNVLDDLCVHCLLEALSTLAIEWLAFAAALTRILIRLLQRLTADSLVVRRQEDNLAICRLGHGLHSLQISDLHGRCRRQDISSLAHELRALDLGARGDDLGLSDPLGLSGHRQRVLQLVVEDDVLDQHAFNLYAPAGSDVFDDLADGLCNLLAALNHILQHTGADDMAEGGLSALNESLADVGDAKSRFVRRCDVVVDDGGEVDVDVVLGHADLAGHLDDLDLDVHLDEFLREWVDLDKTRVDSPVEAAEFGDEADVALVDGLVGVGTNDAAGDRTAEAHPATQGIDCDV